jgi:hypothetical protein
MPERDGVEFDQESQLKQIQPWILPNERLFSVYDCKGSGADFVAITNKRLLFNDKEFLRKRKAFTSVPYSKCTAVSIID